MQSQMVNTRVAPSGGSLDVLSRKEVGRLRDASSKGLHHLLKRCALAVLTTGSLSDNPRGMMAEYPDFDIQVLQRDRGLKIELTSAPPNAFVDGEIIQGANELLMAVVRDIVYVATTFEHHASANLDSESLTNMVFEILRNARALIPHVDPSMVVCWGGHSISRREYQYSKDVGYQLGLRCLDVCTGCGPGAMKGPMKGANLSHAKQRRHDNRYVGITEPGIIAAESPNPIVNQLIIMPDIEKRLEAFVRMGHGIIVFPGGVGTCEEILYLLGILMHPDNRGMSFPLVFTGPESSASYFEQIDTFLRMALGEEVSKHYAIVVDDAVEVARLMATGVKHVKQDRLASKDAFYFNWGLTIPYDFQQPFSPTHEAMQALDLHIDRPKYKLAADLRRAFSGIVAGNVKEAGMQAIEAHGPFVIHGDEDIMQALDTMLEAFVADDRMKLPGGAAYTPCYQVKK